MPSSCNLQELYNLIVEHFGGLPDGEGGKVAGERGVADVNFGLTDCRLFRVCIERGNAMRQKAKLESRLASEHGGDFQQKRDTRRLKVQTDKIDKCNSQIEKFKNGDDLAKLRASKVYITFHTMAAARGCLKYYPSGALHTPHTLP